MKAEYVKTDLAGFPYNAAFPPSPSQYGNDYHGYRTYNEESFFYEFAVQYYDLSFRYNGNYYYIMQRDNKAYLTDSEFKDKLEEFDNGNALLRQLKIEGRPLIGIINDVEDIDFW